ncbi:MAG: response regulator transcription factor [Actinobacteria bacterium]|nr:response regulator transcription factor [Actinomycetota bacterium]
MKGRILVIEDEPAIRRPIVYALQREGFEVSEAPDGETALGLETTFDLVVLDLMLPGMSGFDVLDALRRSGPARVLILTARDSEIDRVVGLECGADDYIVKPFSVAELVSRVRAQLRRRDLDRDSPGQIITAAGITLDLSKQTASVDGTPVNLTPSEFKLLTLLSDAPGTVRTRHEIMRHLWQSDHLGNERTSETHIANVRKKLDRAAGAGHRIVTVRGSGYRLATDT